MRRSTKKCPECDGDMVIENLKTHGRDVIVRRCNNLVAMNDESPLLPCCYEEEIYKNGRVKNDI